jgi:hypothetical protein
MLWLYKIRKDPWAHENFQLEETVERIFGLRDE